MIIKTPACYDTSYYETIADFANVFPRPVIVCTKATEGSSIKDSKFLTYWTDLKQDNIRRMCYHFHRKAIDASLQAANFINTVKAGGVDAKDYFVLDIEEGGETPAQIITWLDRVESSFTNTILLYSTHYLFTELIKKCTPAQLTRLKKHPLWIAWYPANPDNYTELPASYRPVGLGSVWMWQYSENGIVSGITGMVDLNWLDPAFRAVLGVTSPPVETDIITTPYNGVTRTTGTRYGWRFVYHDIDPSKVTIKSAYLSPLDTVSNVGRYNGATLAMNAGEWDRMADTINYTVCNGALKVFRNTAQPSLMVTDNNQIIIDHKVQTANIRQAFTGLRYLVGTLAQPSQWINEGHSRTVYGVDAAGHLLVLSTEGAYPNQGWTLAQCREFMLSQNAILAFDAGGGGDVTMWDKSKGLLLTPENPNGYERYLPNIFMIFTTEANTMTRYTAKAINNDTRLRPDHNTAGAAVGSYPAGTIFSGDVLFTAPVALYNGSVKYQEVGDVWLQVTSPAVGWVAVTNLGKPITTLTDNGATPPVVKIDSLTIEPAPGTVFTYLYNDGTTKKETV